ncbi:hypothetical protein FDZ74_03350, partial [bacterium]
MKRRFGLLLNYPYLWGILLGLVLIVFAFIRLLEPYETVGFIHLPLHASGAGAYQGVEEGGGIPVVAMSVIQEALHDQGFDSATASAISTQLYQELLTPVATATPGEGGYGSATTQAAATAFAGTSTASVAVTG